jgi:hypothetical protein
LVQAEHYQGSPQEEALCERIPAQTKDLQLESLPIQLTRTTDQLPFPILNHTIMHRDDTPMAKRLLIFMSESGRDVLASCTSWYVDGTFKLASNTLFSQITKL